MYNSERAERLQAFMLRYRDNLAAAVRDYPEEYGYSVADVTAVAIRMSAAILRKSFDKDSRAIRATCKQLGIRHTYKAINAYLEESSVGARYARGDYAGPGGLAQCADDIAAAGRAVGFECAGCAPAGIRVTSHSPSCERAHGA